jgi:RimJ/RimL family protein N-acetyltransferase
MPAIPDELRTTRLLLRAWSGSDAPALRPVLIANHEHLRPWIPERVSTPLPLPELAERLNGYAADRAACIAFRFAIRDPSARRVLGEVSLFPRDAASRVALDDADRVEIGYWLAKSATRRGLATEAVEAMLRLASTLPGMDCAEIHCSAENLPSAAVPRRLGFELATQDDGLQVWRKALIVATVPSRCITGARRGAPFPDAGAWWAPGGRDRGAP